MKPQSDEDCMEIQRIGRAVVLPFLIEPVNLKIHLRSDPGNVTSLR